MLNALEIDFIPVGSNSKSGDAIAFRMGTCIDGKWARQHVFTVDGGDMDSGKQLVEHVKEHYHTTNVKAAILTHPDSDHASGMRTVMNELQVESIWMHRPWKYWRECESYIRDGRITRASWERRLQDAYSYAYEIEQIANRKRITINHAHQGYGLTDGAQTVLKVLGPSKKLYLGLIEASDKTPAMREGARQANRSFGGEKSLVYENMSFATEHLVEADGDTSPENDMSIILFLQVAGARILLTGDAGTMALYNAIRYAKQEGYDLQNMNLLQVPHHGSRHNLSKGVLQNISAAQGMISCTAAESDHHPSPVIVNALIRRNISPIQTAGNKICSRYGEAPPRLGWHPVAPINFISSFLISD